MFTGAGKIAAKYDMAVVFFNIQKVKRGYYNLNIELLFDHTAGLSENVITETHVRRLEEIIRKNPNTGYGAIGDGNIKNLLRMLKTAIVILNWNGLGLSEEVSWNCSKIFCQAAITLYVLLITVQLTVHLNG